MGLFSKFKKSEKTSSRSANLTVESKQTLTNKAVKIGFSIPSDLKEKFNYKPGQYLSLHVSVNDESLRRSYSICSGPNEALAIGIKAIENGKVSNYLVNDIKVGDTIEVDFPEGNFTVNSESNIVAFVAGSGITPIMSIAKSIEGSSKNLTLFYSNSTQVDALFVDELKQLTTTKTNFFYSRELVEGAGSGRFDKNVVSEIIKSNLNLLRADGFYLCGPEELILNTQEVLIGFGVEKSKIHFELFTTPVLMKSESTGNNSSKFEGVSKVTAILDGEVVHVDLAHNGKTILDALDSAGMDVPYSCKGGVCCTCKAKITEGSVNMKVNYALTDAEVSQGYILTCQSHPTSEVLKLDFDA